MIPLMDNVQRRRQNLNPLTTQLNQGHLQPYPRASAAALSMPFHNQTPYTPLSAATSYNPQEWSAGPGGYPPDHGGRYSPAALDLVNPLAPPPYSPPRSGAPATFSPQEPNHALSPMRRPSPSNYRPSPEPPTTSFPPPPPPGGRQRSRDRPQPLLSQLGNVFHRKVSTPEISEAGLSRSSIDMHREHGMTSNARRPPPLALEPMRAEEFPNLVVDRPPSSRRAASAGAVGAPSSSRSRNSSTSRWEPGMPLPPPPPGPPPQSSSRSQSLTRDPSTAPVNSPPTRRPQAISSLGPIPPTPAGWVDSPRRLPSDRPTLPPLHIGASSSASNRPDETDPGSGSASFSGSGAVRGEPRSIRERRSASRSGKQVAIDESSNNPWAEAITPSDIVVPPMTVLGRRPTINKSTPRSARFAQNQDTPNSAKSNNNTTPRVSELQQSESRGSTPRPLNSSTHVEAPTPPFSPDSYGPAINQFYPNQNPNVPPKSLPTPPPILRKRTDSSPRPISHLLHTPIRDQSMPPPISSIRTTSRQSSTAHSPITESFCQAAHQRHQNFIDREAFAGTDEDRVRLFAEFIVSESRIRREKYAVAIDGMGSEILELTRDLFLPFSHTQRNSASSSSGPKSGGHRSTRNLAALQTGAHSDSTPSSAGSMVSPAPGVGRPESTWWTGYMPSLSPIPSMTASQAMDETSSRGRPSSRWWEVGQSGSGGSPTIMERSKRESKYMGMPRELRESLQWEGNDQSVSSQTSSKTGKGNQQHAYGPNEYPPEKVGWHEEGRTPPPQQRPMHMSYSPAPVTPNPRHLDVSRLVTLPPPYPRHHPAVNNNHPVLTAIRVSVRALSDFSEVEKVKQQFESADEQARNDAKSLATERRKALRSDIHSQIEAGIMSYSEAAKSEESFVAIEAEATKASTKESFDLFQSAVVAPVNDLLMDRVLKSTDLFEELRGQLFVDAHTQDPNATQEEGDEQPELLEKLTLLKWIFEAREGLHKELFELLSDRNDRYKDMVIEPYRLAGRPDKVANAEKFFADDALKRRLEFEQGALQRASEFLNVVESNVVRGVEVQLSAFWDIAPGLVSLIEKVPQRISHESRIQIPQSEYEENPGYHEFPMQYLYSLLEHGGRSTYQFMESQINLLCLLHEVKNAIAGAKFRVVMAERIKDGHRPQDIAEETEEGRQQEERDLTEDLKEKVRCVEEQWESALGKELESVKTRVRHFLQDQNGWEGMEYEA